MKNRNQKGNYYKRRTKDFFESQGYIVEGVEKTFRVMTKDKITGEPKIIFVKRDLWGSDLCLKTDKEMIFVQVKSNPGDIAAGIKELNATVWPPFIKRWVVIWAPRAREPEIIDAGR